MSTYPERGRNEATPPGSNAERPLDFSFDLTPAATERSRLLALLPYPLVRTYLWIRGGVAVGLAALERSFKYLLIALLSFIAGYSSYTTDYAAHLRAYWQPRLPVLAEQPSPKKEIQPPAAPEVALAPVSKKPVPTPGIPAPATTRPQALATPRPAPPPPAVQPPVVTTPPPVASVDDFVGEMRDPNIPLFHLNRSPSTSVAEVPAAAFDARPVEERTLEHRQEAAATGKRILYYFSADWCLPCKVMESEVFSDAQVARTLREQFVLVKSDIETLDGYELKQHYGVASLPGFLVLDRYGRELGRANAAMPLSRFKAFLRSPSQVFTAATRPGPRLR